MRKTKFIPATQNKLRDTDLFYYENNHIFNFNNEIITTFEICNICEAHNLLNYERLKLFFYYLLKTNKNDNMINSLFSNKIIATQFDWKISKSYVENFLFCVKNSQECNQIFQLTFPYIHTIYPELKHIISNALKEVISLMDTNNLVFFSDNYSNIRIFNLDNSIRKLIPQFTNCPYFGQ